MKIRSKQQSEPSSPTHEHKGFDGIVHDATHDMPAYRRRFSAFIHSKMVWFISDLIGKTIARPNALLFGAILSFAVTLGVYLLSKNFGYSLSGFESIGAFLVGWTIGIFFDILSSLRRGKE